MTLTRRLAEAPPGLRWHVSRLWTELVLRRAFGHIGARTVIVSPLVLRGVDRIRIGDDCAVYLGVWLQCEPSGGPIDIGDRTYLGHRVHIHAFNPVNIGRGCVFADDVLVSSGGHAAGDRQGVTDTGPIDIGDDGFVGQRAMVLGGVTVGRGATVGAGAVVTHDVPPGAVVAGVPARVLRKAEG